MTVYLVVHDDRVYDMGDTFVRGVFLTKQTAEASIVTRTPSGQKSRAYGAHDQHCCYVDEREVLDAPRVDVKPDPEPLTREQIDAGALIPESIVDALR